MDFFKQYLKSLSFNLLVGFFGFIVILIGLGMCLFFVMPILGLLSNIPGFKELFESFVSLIEYLFINEKLSIFFFFVSIASYFTVKELTDKLTSKYDIELNNVKNILNESISLKEQAKADSELWKKTLEEKSSGIPSILEAIKELDEKRDKSKVDYLKYKKKHPALKSGEIVKLERRKRREAEFNFKKIKAIIEYYESIAPFLLDYQDDIPVLDDEYKYEDYTEEERSDPVTNYLTKEDFRKLPTIEKNQLALDRFWNRNKPKWLIGRIYERYVGYLYEKKGYDVEYIGIHKGLEDLGRDLICTKGNEHIVIQCKYWSKFRTVYENNIFQFFGTVFQYKDKFQQDTVKGLFYTTTQVSELARRFSLELGIELKENFPFDKNYPCIKCNISTLDKTKIYHLPFDQMYDHVKIEPKKGEFYCTTVKEAEEKGFRRAFRYKGINKNA